MKVNILDYGAIGDGVTDCYGAFQEAENDLKSLGEYGEIYVPAGRYLVSKPFYHWSNITLRGDGVTSIITNDLEPGDNADDSFCILIGNFKPSSFGKCIHYEIQDIKAGQNYVKFSNKKDMNEFVVGECVLIDSVDGFIGNKGDFKPYCAFINMVIKINKEERLLYLEDEITTSIIGAKIARAINDNSKEYICQFPIIKDIAFESKDNWTMRFGCYKGVFKNISIKSTDIIPGNGLSWCSFENIKALFSQKIVELATYSHNTKVTNLKAVWYDGHEDPTEKPLLKMGENIRDCVFSDFNIDARQMRSLGMIMRFEHAFGNKVINSSFQSDEVSGGVVELTTTDDAGIVIDNEVKNNTFTIDKARFFVYIDRQDSEADISSNIIVNNQFFGEVDNKAEAGNMLSLNKVNNTYS